MLSFIKELTGKLVQLNDSELESLYLEYFNDFLTIDRFAECHNFTRYEASRIIDKGREINHKRIGL